MQGKSDPGKICSKRRIHAPNKPTAARRDFVFTRVSSPVTWVKELQMLLFFNKSGIKNSREFSTIATKIEQDTILLKLFTADMKYSGAAEH
jgi:mannitol/fructose-specific phosphotransferase system IIA component (Ntr-type)